MRSNQGFVTAPDGVRLFFHQLGTGPGAVIIPNALHMIENFQCLASDRTVILFDLRNRGRSESVADSARLARGIHHDIDDLEAVRRHCGVETIDIIGHSYQGLAAVLYAMKYPRQVHRLVQIGAMQARAATEYPAHLTGADSTLAEFHARLAEMQTNPGSEDPVETGRKFWALLRRLMVASPADAGKITWKPYEYPNELQFLRQWSEHILPSIQALQFAPEELAAVRAPVLVIHGVKDRQSPYGAGREWAMLLPDARLVTVPNAAHVPWIEAPELVFGSIRTFLDGAWPRESERVTMLDPGSLS
jgi:pimeloyl-ACP methyl ester carboxylesterase